MMQQAVMVGRGQTIAATIPANMSALSNAVEPQQANAQVAFNNAGGWSLSAFNGTVSPAGTGTWWDGVNPASAYEIRWNLISGVPTTGPAVETWHSLSATRIWTCQGTNFTQGEIQIREAATGTILAAGVVILEAYTDPGGGA